MRMLLFVGVGGFLGAALRYVLGDWAQQASRSVSFPYGTLAVNLLGCFIIGALAYLLEARSAFTPEMRSLVFRGILGGLTTFSTFGLETFNLLRAGELGAGVSNVALNNLAGLGLVWAGYAAAALLWR
ncbi:MAG: fluoride efflux transporter CrcB [Chloroflexi bacterium]|nr:fluoride efflux transporter CrcB [Chloroflexota bacterium]